MFDKINVQLKEALIAKDELQITVLRSLLAALHNKEIERKGTGEEKKLEEKDIQDVLRKEAKKRSDAMKLYKDAGRNELAEKEQAEKKIIDAFLPAQMNDHEVEELVKRVVSELGEGAEFGAVMKVAMQKAEGMADGSVVSAVVKKVLAS